MKNYISLMTLLFSAFILFSCSQDEDPITPEDPSVPVDYRDEFTGEYESTKSSNSFEDILFTTDILVTVEKDSLSDTNVVVNGQIIPIDEDGNFGPDFHNGQYFDLMISDGNLRLSINEVFPNGLALPCFILGELR